MFRKLGRPFLGDESQLYDLDAQERKKEQARQRKQRQRKREELEQLVDKQIRGQHVTILRGGTIQRHLPKDVENGAYRGDLEQLALEAGFDQDTVGVPRPAIEERLLPSDEYPQQYNSDDGMPFDAQSDYITEQYDSPASSNGSASHYQSPVYHDMEEEMAEYEGVSIQDEELHPQEDSASVVSYGTAPSEWLHSTQLPSQSTKQRAHTHRGVASSHPNREHDFEPNILLASANNTFTRSTVAFKKACEKQDAIQMLLQHLHNFQGCSADEHMSDLQVHNNEFTTQGTMHYRLSEVTEVQSTQSVLGRTHMLSKSESAQKKLDRQKLQRLFEGRVDEDSHQPSGPRNICIHKSHASSLDAEMCSTTFDVDSHFGWATSLAAMKEGFSMYFPPPKVFQMSSNLHIRHSKNPFAGVFEPGLEGSVRLDVATHVCLGIVPSVGATVYIYFPNIHNPSTLLTDEQTEVLFDKVVLKALRKCGPHDSISSFPPSTAAARKRATAGSTELHTRKHVRSGALAQLEYHVHERTCSVLWEHIVDIIDDESATNTDIAKFSGAQIFFTAKNHKQKYRTSSLLETLELFDGKLHRAYDLESIHFLAIDLGKEVTTLSHTHRAGFFRRCCVKRAISKLFTSMDGKEQNPTESTPPSSSILGQAGVMYWQWYSQVKQKWDVTKHYPFAGENINALAAGKQRWESLAQVGKATGDFTTTERAYCHSKQRIHIEACPSRDSDGVMEMHYPAREEIRLAHPSFSELLVAARLEQEDALHTETESLSGDSQPHPATTPLWLIPSQEYSTFVWTIMNQTCAYLETILATTGHTPSPEQSRVLLLLIEMLRAFIQATNYPVRRALWLHSKFSRSKETTEIGAGFSYTMMTFGFCWIKQGLINWESHHFRSQFRRYILFDQAPLYARFKMKRPEVIDHDELQTAILEMIDVVRCCEDKNVHRIALQLIVNLVLRQFRQDIRDTIDPKDALPEFRGRLTEANFRFCLKDLQKTCGYDYYFVGRDRANRTMQNPDLLLEKFFGDLDQSRAAVASRLHFHKKPYRRLAWSAQERLRKTNFIEPPYRSLGGTAFQTFLRLACLEQHMILPAPSEKCGHLTELKKANKASGVPAQRQWIAVRKEAHKGHAIPNPMTHGCYSLGGEPSRSDPAVPDANQRQLLDGTPQQLVERLRALAEDCLA